MRLDFALDWEIRRVIIFFLTNPGTLILLAQFATTAIAREHKYVATFCATRDIFSIGALVVAQLVI